MKQGPGSGGQRDLFGLPPFAQGYAYEPDFLSVAEEASLLGVMRELPLAEAKYKEYRAKRRVVSYGGRFDYDSNTLNEAAPIPEFLQPLRTRVAAWANIPAEQFNHALVAEYAAGVQLGWHRDVPDFEVVVGVSLLSACRMRFRRYSPIPLEQGTRPLGLREEEPAQHGHGQRRPGRRAPVQPAPAGPPSAGRDKGLAIELAPRSIYRLQGEARWGWQHSVPPVPALRYSITFRTLRVRSEREKQGDELR